MGLMRRRPLLRAAAVSAGSYAMGKRHEREEAAASPAAPTAVQPPAAPAPSNLDQLEQLGRLHDQGVLTDDEFAQQKAKLLGS